MGATGTGVFANDLAEDVKADFRALIAEGLAPQAAVERLRRDYKVGNATGDQVDFWLALAVTAHRLGRLLPEVREQAEAAAAAEDLRRWDERDRQARRRVVQRALDLLAEEQPPPKVVRAQPVDATALQPGQHFLYEYREGRRVMFRVQTVLDGTTPLLTLLDWEDDRQVPDGDALVALPVAKDESGQPLGVGVSGTSDPSSRMTMLDVPAPQRTSRWRRRPSSTGDGILRTFISWRHLPRWLQEHGRE